jgi:hypothetical protein
VHVSAWTTTPTWNGAGSRSSAPASPTFTPRSRPCRPGAWPRCRPGRLTSTDSIRIADLGPHDDRHRAHRPKSITARTEEDEHVTVSLTSDTRDDELLPPNPSSPKHTLAGPLRGTWPSDGGRPGGYIVNGAGHGRGVTLDQVVGTRVATSTNASGALPPPPVGGAVLAWALASLPAPAPLAPRTLS